MRIKSFDPRCLILLAVYFVAVSILFFLPFGSIRGACPNNAPLLRSSVVAIAHASSGFVPPLVTRVVFPKVPRTGGSSVANMMFRFGEQRGLKILGANPHISEAIFPSRQVYQNAPYDILTSHITWSEGWVHEVIPDGHPVVMLREPKQYVISNFFWHYDFAYALPNMTAKVQFLKEVLQNECKDCAWRFSQAKYLGLELGDKANIGNALREFDQEWPLQLVTEMFDESIVLMLMSFNWSLWNGLYLNMKVESESIPRDDNLDKETVQLLHDYIDPMDEYLYTHAVSRAKELMKAQGHKFVQALKDYKKLLNRVQKICSAEDRWSVSRFEESGFQSAELILRLATFCDRLAWTSVEYAELLSRRSSLTYGSDDDGLI